MRRSCSMLFLLVWVLWTQTRGPNSNGWSAASGFATEEKCLANMQEKMEAWRRFDDAIFTKNRVTFTGNNSMIAYLCLPDTEDPRPKTKKEAPVK